MKTYNDFPQALKDRVYQIRKEQKKQIESIPNTGLAALFSWKKTKEGHNYWLNLHQTGNFSEFEKKFELKDKVIVTISKKGVKHITEVEDMYGSTYSIGDKFRIIEKTSSNYGKIFKILNFRWNNDKTRICAITKTHNYGIRLDWIEHYVEPKKEPEFVLPKKWYVKNIPQNEIDIVCQYGNKMWSTLTYVCTTWKPCSIRILIGNYTEKGQPYFTHPGFTHKHIEITFEQFKQYVLFGGYKIGDKINTISSTNVEIINLQYINGQSVIFYKNRLGHQGCGYRVLLQNIVK